LIGAGDVWIVSATTVVARGVAFAAIVLATGAGSFRWAVLPRWPIDVKASRRYRAFAAAAGAWAAAAVVVAAPGRLYLQARSLVDVTDPVTPMMANVLRTTWGHGWLLQLASAVAAVAGWLLVRQHVLGAWLLAMTATLLLALSPALMGHAVAADRLLVVSLLADWLHVLGAGAWIGALSLMTIVVVSMNERSAGNQSAADLIAAFHPVALGAATLLVATGVVSLLLRVERVGDLFHSSYGAILGVKLALTGGVMALGWRHARHGPPMPDMPGAS